MKFEVIGSVRRNAIAFGVFATAYILIGVAMTVFQERLVYYPYAKDFNDCSEMRGAEKIVHGATRMYFKDNGPRVGVIYHGNAGSACDRSYIASLFDNAKISYLVPEYTGYSSDGQSPSHEGAKANARDVVAFLEDKNFSEVIVVGESIGTGVASYHASLEAPDKILLISPFTSLLDIARDVYWFYPVKLVVDSAYNNVSNLSTFEGEALILHGSNDEIIRTSMGKELFGGLRSENKTMKIIDGAGHNDLWADDETYTAITDFIK